MNTQYEQLKNTIKENRRTFDKLFLELRALRVSAHAWTTENYQKEESRIIGDIAKVKNELDRNQELLATFDYIKSSCDNIKIAEDTKENDSKNMEGKDLYESQVKHDIAEAIYKLPKELREEAKSIFHSVQNPDDDIKILKLEREMSKLHWELESYNLGINASTRYLLDEMNQERNRLESGVLFTTEKELDDYYLECMNKKIALNNSLEEARKKAEITEKKIQIIEKEISDRRIVCKEAKKLNISADDYENIVNRVNKRAELSKFLRSIGRSDLVDKQNKVLPLTKEELEYSKKVARDKLVEDRINQAERAKIKSLPSGKEIKQLEKNNQPVENKKPTVADNIKEYINNNPPKNVNSKKADYGYKTIINNLVKGLEPNKKDGKRYRAANIEIRESFKNELRSGNYLYNIVHVVPAVIKLPIQLIRKITAKITYRESAKKRMATIKERLDNLDEKDLDILFNEYANHIETEKYGTGLNILIGERINKYINKKVTDINNTLTKNYKEIVDAVRELDALNYLLHRKDISSSARSSYEAYRTNLLKGKAKVVESVRNSYDEAKRLLSSGLHGFNENVRATESKMSYIGKRFAKDHDLDVELLDREAKLERAEKKAINDGNDEMALRCFVEAESLLSKNTNIEKSIFGKRSTGKKYYSPLAEKLDYSNDPFVRDIFTTVAVVGAAVSVFGAANKQSDLQKQIEEVNAHNEKAMKTVNNAGEVISNKRAALEEGMNAQNYQDSLNVSNVLERKALDQSSEVHGGWSVGTNTYYNARTQAQNTYNDFYNSTKDAIYQITDKYATGGISQLQAMNMLADVSKTSQATLKSVVNDALPHLVNYANNHSQFDLAGVEDAMNYIINHPDAITNMNKGMLEAVELGEDLATLSIEQVNLLNTLPDNISKTLFGAASASALALQVNNRVNNTQRKNKYGNEVTDMLNSYMDFQDKVSSSKTK